LFKVFGIHSGLNLTVFDVIAGPALGDSVKSEPCLAIDILFSASGQGWMVPPEGGDALCMPYRKSTMYLTFAPHGATGRYDVPEGTRFLGIDIRIGLDFLDRLGRLSTFAGLTRDHPCHVASCDTCWIGAFRLPEGVAQGARRLLDNGLSDENDLAMEARCLDIIDAAISCLSEPAEVMAATNRDRRRIDAAHEMLLADLSRNWTIAELARQCCLSEKRLKAGFRARFGNPVYRHFQLVRLNEARRMLEVTDKSVTEISLSVGYTSTSHFSRLFEREFGILPSKLKV
ncbi:AraC family transcriptional regulator, partial [Salmonella enterica subsp. enterica serovar Virchow]|nr:AraC family transcriptional regulator [Salmonella enterica subsp. enterica serovar Virchow]